jgi:hypothetical protein
MIKRIVSVKLRNGSIDEDRTCGQHLESQRHLQQLVDLLVSLGDTVWSVVTLEKQSFYAAQLLLICLTPPGHLMLTLVL